MVQNRKTRVSETKDEDDDDDEEMPEETGNGSYDTSKRDEQIRTNLEEDVIRIHTDGEISQDEKIKHGDLTEPQINRIDTVVYHSTGNFWG